MRSRLIVVALFASALIWMALTRPTSTHAAVGLISFDVEQVEEGIRVTWETGSEVNNLGFNLYRSVTRRSQGARLDFFPAAGGVGGAQYEYLDTDMLPNTTYYYTLEALDVNGTGQYFGPLEITFQPAANATAIPTFTFTPYPTATIVPVTISFTADTSVINRGTCTYLRWSVSGAQIQAAYLDGLQVALSGTRQVCPTDTTTYSLTVIYPGGSQEALVQIVVRSVADSTLYLDPSGNLSSTPYPAVLEVERVCNDPCRLRWTGRLSEGTTGDRYRIQGLYEFEATRAYTGYLRFILSRGGNEQKLAEFALPLTVGRTSFQELEIVGTATPIQPDNTLIFEIDLRQDPGNTTVRLRYGGTTGNRVIVRIEEIPPTPQPTPTPLPTFTPMPSPTPTRTPLPELPYHFYLPIVRR